MRRILGRHLAGGGRLLTVSVAAMIVLATWGSPGARASVSRHHVASVAAAAKLGPAPHDPFAKQDKRFKGQTIVYYGGSVGSDHVADVPLAKQFTKDTGIKITIQEQPATGSDALTQLQRVFGSGSSSIDVTRIDVVWPGTLAPYLLDLKKPLAADAKLEIGSLLKNDTVGGHLVGVPYQGDFGMLYYRKDLLHKYGYKSPPTTWTQMTAMAKKIEKGEQKTNKSFYGYVFQGNAYEGLTCNALEWIASYGGGTIVNSKGQVTINNAKAKAALALAHSWVGSISPKGVTTYQETETAGAFDAGDAAFARNWPYMTGKGFALDSPKVKGKWAVAPLPHGPGGHSVATVGGWQIAVSKFTKHVGASEAWARYYASKPVQVWRALNAAIVPTMASVGSVKSVKKAMPFLTTVGNHTMRVVRPSSLKNKYNQGSTAIFQGVNSILRGQESVSSGVSAIDSQLKNLHP